MIGTVLMLDFTNDGASLVEVYVCTDLNCPEPKHTRSDDGHTAVSLRLQQLANQVLGAAPVEGVG